MPEGPEVRFLSEMIKKKVINNELIKIVALSKRKVPLPKNYIMKIKNIQTCLSAKLLRNCK